MKICNKCHKESTQFYKDKAFKDGLRNICKSCDNKKTKRNYRKYDLKKRYSLTLEQYDVLFKSQEGRCKICNISEDNLGYKLCVDHCHKTGIVRGLLCKPCNLIVGNSKENIEILKKAITYVGEYAIK